VECENSIKDQIRAGVRKKEKKNIDSYRQAFNSTKICFNALNICLESVL
jgi:hypothetical protein